MALWLRSTISGHPFIAESYWHESETAVRDIYLPHSKTWTYMQADKLLGFVSILEQRFVGALFVDPLLVGKGIGSQLMRYVQSCYSSLSLEVYQKNRHAIHFYHRMGFHITEAAWQHDTQHPTWIMCWKKDDL